MTITKLVSSTIIVLILQSNILLAQNYLDEVIRFEDGQTEATYKKGKTNEYNVAYIPTGYAKYFDKNGVLRREGYWKKKLFNDKWIVYDKDGIKINEIIYSEGITISEKYFHKNGSLSKEITLDKEHEAYFYEYFDINGNIKERKYLNISQSTDYALYGVKEYDILSPGAVTIIGKIQYYSNGQEYLKETLSLEDKGKVVKSEYYYENGNPRVFIKENDNPRYAAKATDYTAFDEEGNKAEIVFFSSKGKIIDYAQSEGSYTIFNPNKNGKPHIVKSYYVNYNSLKEENCLINYFKIESKIDVDYCDQSIDKTYYPIDTDYSSQISIDILNSIDSLYVEKITNIKKNNSGKFDGMVRNFYKSGNLEQEANFKDNLQTGKTYFYYDNAKNSDKKGSIEIEQNYIKGLKEGTRKEFYKNGNLSYTVNYIEDKKNGVAKTYYDNGTLKKEEIYLNDKKNGTTKEYSKN